MSQSGKLMPHLDQHSTKILNLTVLQRIDQFIEEILITAAHVTLYEFNVDLNQWGRKDVEGSLFVVKRNAQPRFQFIVMNRRNTENLVEDLLGEFEFEVQVPYLLYRNARQEVNGIWFYTARECEEVASLFNRIIGAYSKVPQKSKVSKAKSEFEELEAEPSMAVMDGPLEPSTSTASKVAAGPDDPSFLNFFSAAMNVGTATNTAITAQSYQSSATVGLLSRPPIVFSSAVPTLHTPSPIPTSTPLMPLLDSSEQNGTNNRSTSLLKPSVFFAPPPSGPTTAPVSSPLPTAPPLQPAVSLQRPYGTPMLQPFPPPTPPPSLTPTSASSNFGSLVSREKVKEALLVLTQDNQFIDMVYRALVNAHHS